ncbi:MAG: glycosyltransferase family 1 protein [Candidatus Jorgensenbacteria bacterium]|nr:glycosyltransferase family 1 protein [Candidatus Jorgensenbacteria bacterium]
MKILIDTRLLSKGRISGIEEYARFVIQNLLEKDKENIFQFFYSGIKKAEFPENWKKNNTSLLEWNIPNKLLELSMRITGMPHIEEKLNSDIVFSPHFNFLPKPKNAKRVITFHDLSFVHFPEFYPARKRFWHWQQDYLRQANLADAIIAVSEFTRQDIIKTLGVSSDRVHTIHSGINPFYKQLPENDKSRASFVKEKRLTRPFLLFAGTLEPRKNISGIIKAFEVVKEDLFNSELQLIIVGKRGWLCDTIFKDAENSKWKSDIIFWGESSYEDLRLLYNLADAFVYPSFFEGFGFPPLEAQACGAPVITSNRSSLPEIVGDSALLVDPWKVEELAHAMQLILKNEKVRIDLRKKGFENIKRFSWTKATDELMRVFNKFE